MAPGVRAGLGSAGEHDDLLGLFQPLLCCGSAILASPSVKNTSWTNKTLLKMASGSNAGVTAWLHPASSKEQLSWRGGQSGTA